MTTPFFHSNIPEGDQHHHHHTQISSFTSPSPLFDTQHHHETLHLHQEIMKGSTWRNDDYGSGIHRSSSSSSDHPQKPVKWMSSKMRIMRKMIINSYQTPASKSRRCSNINDHHLHDHNNKKANLDTNIIRVCSDCNTTKTPLWRSGPSGPKSLCNACGIRQRKARRAMAAAAVKDNGTALEVDRTVPFKKRCRFGAAGCVDQRKICFEEIAIRLSKSSAFQRVFPQDEKDAAILLMALSCGLLCSS